MTDPDATISVSSDDESSSDDGTLEVEDLVDLKSFDDVSLQFCKHAMAKGALALDYALPRGKKNREAGLREDCTFYLLVHLSAFGIHNQPMQRQLKVLIVGTKRKTKASKVPGAVPLPCKWGDPLLKAPTLTEVKADLLTYKADNRKLFCLRLAVPTAVVHGKAIPDVGISYRDAFAILDAAREEVQKLKVRYR